jgi:transposase InsO family protein
MNSNQCKLLSKIYYDPKHPASFASVQSLWKATNGAVPKKIVEEWLSGQETYTLHRPARKRFPRNRYYVDNIDTLWQADLNDMRSLKDKNDQFCHLLTIIDVFSKYAWTVPLYSKTGTEVANAFEKVFKQDKRIPLKLQTDKGTEFLNKTFQDCLKKHNIVYYSTNTPDLKACIVERFNRSL